MWDDGWGPDPDLKFLAVAWAHAARTQLDRVQVFDKRLQTRTSEDPDPLTVADSWQEAADTHFAFLSLAHVVKVCDLVPELPDFPDAEVLVLLRNFAEHWEDPGGRSGRALNAMHVDPLSVGILWSGALRYVSGSACGSANSAVRGWLTEVDRVARSLVTDDEDPIPNPSERLF